MGGELGKETYIDVLLESSASSTKFDLDRERRFLYDVSVEKLVRLSFVDISRRDRVGKKKNSEFFIYFYFVMCNVVSGSALKIFKS